MTVDSNPNLSIVIPAYNERARLPRTLRMLRRYMDEASLSVELVLVDDGSTDGTDRIMREASEEDDRIRPLLGRPNGGKGLSVREGLLACRGLVCMFMDADLAYGLDPIAELYSRIQDGADMVTGARDLSHRDSRWRYSPIRRLATSVFGLLAKGVTPVHIPDTQCGFKGFRRVVAREIARSMTVDGFAFDIEMLFLARLWSLRIDRIPVEMSESQGSTIHLMKDSLQMIRDLGTVRVNVIRGRYPTRPGHI